MRCSSPAVWIQKSTDLTADYADFTDRRGCLATENSRPSAQSAVKSILHSDWMTRDVTAGVAPVRIPARTDIAAMAQIGRVEAQTGDDCEGVAGPRINGDPSSA